MKKSVINKKIKVSLSLEYKLKYKGSLLGKKTRWNVRPKIKLCNETNINVLFFNEVLIFIY